MSNTKRIRSTNETNALENALLDSTVLDVVKNYARSGDFLPEGEETSFLTRCLCAYIAQGEDGKPVLSEREKAVLLRWVSFCVAKGFVHRRPFLPYQDEAFRPTESGTELDDWREDILCSLLVSISEGKIDSAIANSRSELDKKITRDGWRGQDNLSLPKEEITDIDFVASLKDLISQTPTGLGREFFSAKIATLFDEVKKAHRFASVKHWQSFENFVLNMTNEQSANLLALSKQKNSRNVHETLDWFLDVVKKAYPQMVAVWRKTLTRWVREGENRLKDAALSGFALEEGNEEHLARLTRRVKTHKDELAKLND